MNEIVIGVVGILGSVSSICFAYLAFRRKEHLDTKANAKHAGILMSDIGYIKDSIERMEKKLDQVEANYHHLLTRIACVEQANQVFEKRLEQVHK